MKKITFSVLAVAALVFFGCKKTVKPEAPVADTELQSSIDATYALFTVTDAEMIASFVSDNSLDPTFYVSSANTFTATQDTAAGDVAFSFNQNYCVDGRLRDGSVLVDRSNPGQLNPMANDNSRYYRSVGFAGRMTLSQYKVDNWTMVTIGPNGEPNGTPCIILNTTTPDNYDPSKVNLSWSIKGNFLLQNGNDTMYCKVDLTKTLLSTSDKTVFASDKKSPIVWARGKVSYSGTLSGYTPGHIPYKMEIKPENAIVRDFTCSPDLVSSVMPTSTTGSVVSKYSQYHPFINGVASFTTSTKYPRQIYYGGSETFASPACDNSGSILIKGISYPFDMRKM